MVFMHKLREHSDELAYLILKSIAEAGGSVYFRYLHKLREKLEIQSPQKEFEKKFRELERKNYIFVRVAPIPFPVNEVILTGKGYEYLAFYETKHIIAHYMKKEKHDIRI